MTQKLDSLKPGDAMTFQGPLGNITYTDRGEFTVFNPATGAADVCSVGLVGRHSSSRYSVQVQNSGYGLALFTTLLCNQNTS
jgi:hypothetical protein